MKMSKYKILNNQYKCECGREFDNPQSLNGHFSHCKIHRELNNKDCSDNYWNIRNHPGKMNGWENKSIEEQNKIHKKSGETLKQKILNGEISPCFSGHIHTQETKDKMSIKRKYNIEHNIGNKWTNPFIKSSFAEEYFKEIFKKYNIIYINNYNVYPYHLDFAFIDKFTYIEIDGEQHYTEKGIIKDNLRTKKLEEKGWHLLKRIRWSEFKKLKEEEKELYIKELIEIINNS